MRVGIGLCLAVPIEQEVAEPVLGELAVDSGDVLAEMAELDDEPELSEHDMGKRTMALGRMGFRPGKRSLALGRASFRPGKRSVALGRMGFRPGKRSLALGRASFRPGKRSLALGRGHFRPGKRSYEFTPEEIGMNIIYS
ncbi:unnamed protein product, partial [Mesorhabditis spiculigera]